jgi:hypothetical protein
MERHAGGRLGRAARSAPDRRQSDLGVDDVELEEDDESELEEDDDDEPPSEGAGDEDDESELAAFSRLRLRVP